MSVRSWIILVGIAFFLGGVGYALWLEMEREVDVLARSISGVVEVDPQLYARGEADVVKTDRMALYLIDEASGEVAALRMLSPLVPPQTFVVGVQDNPSLPAGSYLLVGITDKDGERLRPSRGEVYGVSRAPLPLGSEEIHLWLTAPFKGGLWNGRGGVGKKDGFEGERALTPQQARRALQGTVVVPAALRQHVGGDDRLVIMLFDLQAGRPAAIKVLPRFSLPQPFSIVLPAGEPLAPAYQLRILTDKDNHPVRTAPGELVGRSKSPIPLGTEGLRFALDALRQAASPR